MWIQRDACYRCIPLWLKLVQQAISTRKETRLLDSLYTMIALCCTIIGPQDPLRNAVAEALQGVLKSVTRKNQEVATRFISYIQPELEQLGLNP